MRLGVALFAGYSSEGRREATVLQVPVARLAQNAAPTRRLLWIQGS
jgi:hypothetical protein